MIARRFPAVLLSLLLAACNGEIYLRDGVTDGDTFYLAQKALVDDDPVVQSWVSYSLMRSACQLELGGDNPARQSSFGCEVAARRHLLLTWQEKTTGDAELTNPYLDDLVAIHQAGFLDEHVVGYFRQRGWSMPDDLDMRAYRRWSTASMPRHEPETRLIGSWNYARNAGRD